jgi:hypothetical protein
MFWEEMKRLFYAMKEIEPEDLDEETMDDFLGAMDGCRTSSCEWSAGDRRGVYKAPRASCQFRLKLMP